MNSKKVGGSQNPFETYDQLYTGNMQEPMQTFAASAVSGAQDRERRIAESNVDPTAVSLPPHLFIPADAQSVDIRNLANVPPATTVDLLSFTCPKGNFVKFIGYAVFFDALLFSLINLVPKVRQGGSGPGVRVFPYHGNPQFAYKIGLGVGADLSNTNLIPCQLDLQPGDQVTWTFTNNDVVDVAAGVRMSGYVSKDIIRKTGRFGG